MFFFFFSPFFSSDFWQVHPTAQLTDLLNITDKNSNVPSELCQVCSSPFSLISVNGININSVALEAKQRKGQWMVAYLEDIIWRSHIHKSFLKTYVDVIVVTTLKKWCKRKESESKTMAQVENMVFKRGTLKIYSLLH